MTHRHGIDVSLAELLAFKTARQRVKATGRPQSQVDGDNVGRTVSRGLDVAEIRRYQAGDDVRSIDWKVTARRGETHVKVFDDERAKAVFLLLDLRSAMHFGTRVCLKSVLAARLAATLAWRAHAAGDRVGAWIVSDSGVERLADSGQERAVRRLCHAIVRQHAAPVTDGQSMTLADAMDGVTRGQFAKAEWHIISDFADGSIESTELNRFTGTCWHIVDPLDVELPKSAAWICDRVEQRRLSTRGRDREQHASRHQARVERLRAALKKPGQRYAHVSTVDGERVALLRALSTGSAQ